MSIALASAAVPNCCCAKAIPERARTTDTAAAVNSLASMDSSLFNPRPHEESTASWGWLASRAEEFEVFDVSPAVRIKAARYSPDSGTSRWQLRHHLTPI